MKTRKAFFVRTAANDGNPAKQYVYHYTHTMYKAVVIKKLVLIKKIDLCEWGEFHILKTFKDRLLIGQIFSIKPDTLKAIMKELNL